MFIIAGLQPKQVIMEHNAGRCARCGSNQAQIQRVDHYLSLFFIPLLRVKKGEPFLFCPDCGMPVAPARRDAGGTRPHGTSQTGSTVCNQCGGSLQNAFKYCPHCGQRQY